MYACLKNPQLILILTLLIPGDKRSNRPPAPETVLVLQVLPVGLNRGTLIVNLPVSSPRIKMRCFLSRFL